MSTRPASTSPTSAPTLEKLASDVIQRINDAVRDREGQLLKYEREFRQIAGEVGGTDALAVYDGCFDTSTKEVCTINSDATAAETDETKSMLIGRVSCNGDDDQLAQEFSECGKVVFAYVQINRSTLARAWIRDVLAHRHGGNALRALHTRLVTCSSSAWL